MRRDSDNVPMVQVTLDDKKLSILNNVALGVELHDAMIVARCTFDEMSILQEDEAFMTEVEYLGTKEKMRLIGLYKVAAEAAATKKLDYNGLRAVVKDFYPKATADSAPSVIIQNLTGKYPDAEGGS